MEALRKGLWLLASLVLGLFSLTAVYSGVRDGHGEDLVTAFIVIGAAFGARTCFRRFRGRTTPASTG